MYEYENGESVGLKWQRKTEVPVLKIRPFPVPPIPQQIPCYAILILTCYYWYIYTDWVFQYNTEDPYIQHVIYSY